MTFKAAPVGGGRRIEFKHPETSALCSCLLSISQKSLCLLQSSAARHGDNAQQPIISFIKGGHLDLLEKRSHQVPTVMTCHQTITAGEAVRTRSCQANKCMTGLQSDDDKERTSRETSTHCRSDRQEVLHKGDPVSPGLASQQRGFFTHWPTGIFCCTPRQALQRMEEPWVSSLST